MTTARTILLRTSGTQHGFIRRMVSPGDLGERLKPFVFLDFLNGHVPPGSGFGFHPHSGIATLTYQLNADAAYEDTAGQKGLVEATGLEWMRAGAGTWHQGFIHPHGDRVEGFQLWVALPPGVEDGPSQGIYVPPSDVPQVGNVRVLLGSYRGHASPIPAPSPSKGWPLFKRPALPIVYRLRLGKRFEPPSDQTVGWAFVYSGRAEVSGQPVSAELAVLNESNEAIEIHALDACRVLIGTAKAHGHPLVLGTHSVHTNPQSLAQGIATIRAVGDDLRRAGRM